jgi:hypothetical protein
MIQLVLTFETTVPVFVLHTGGLFTRQNDSYWVGLQYPKIILVESDC